jgi:nucleoside phosphorylase
VPSSDHDIRLGDVVVSAPEGTSGGVVRYDLGKETIDGFQLKGWLNATDQILWSAIANIEPRAGHRGNAFIKHLEILQADDLRAEIFRYPGPENDRLYHAIRTTELVERLPCEDESPAVHCGLMASRNKVIKNAHLRDELRDKHNIICFEMEAAGLMNALPVSYKGSQ